MNSKSFIFFGRSGSGKGTQAQMLIDYLKENDKEREVIYIETGAEFRSFMEQDYYTSKRVKEVLDEGQLLPEFLPIWIWTDFLIKNYTGDEHIVFDGISRRLNEAPVVDGALDFYKKKDRYVIFMNVSKDWAKTRLLERGRYDDNDDDIEERLAWYDTNVYPVIETFRNNDKYKFLDVDAEKSIEEVHKAIIDDIKD